MASHVKATQRVLCTHVHGVCTPSADGLRYATLHQHRATMRQGRQLSGQAGTEWGVPANMEGNMAQVRIFINKALIYAF